MIMGHFGECVAVESGAAAVEKFVGAWNGWSPYDLISLDVQMPEMDGVEVLNRIRALEREKRVPESKRVKVVMVTARSDKDTIMTSIQAGCNDYVVKPFDKTISAKKLTQMGFHVKLF